MNSANPEREQRKLWSTTLGVYRWPQAEAANEVLARVFGAMRALQTDGGKPHFFASGDDLLQRITLPEWQTLVRFIVEGLRDMGAFGMRIPTEYGGLGLDLVTYALVIAELTRGWMAVSGIVNGQYIVGGMIAATAFGIFFVPVFYLATRKWLMRSKPMAPGVPKEAGNE